MNATRGKKMLICTIGVPHRSKGASLVLYYNYIDCLRRNGFKILHLMLLQPDYDRKDFAEYANEMSNKDGFEIIHVESERFYNIKRVPPKINLLSLNDKIINKIKVFNSDYVLCFDILSAGILSNAIDMEALRIKKIVWLGDLNFQTYWYHALYDVREGFRNILRLVPFIVLSRLWKNFYKKLLSNWDVVIVSSKSSEKELEKIDIKSTYLPYPWPVTGNISRLNLKKESIPSFVFFGTLTGLGSRSAFHFLIKFLYRKLIGLFGKGKFQIFICGSRGLPEWVKNRIKEMKEIKYLGFVEDLNPLLAACHAVIVPIDVPVGNRSRIVTAMAAGALVIAHKNTALGNPELVNGKTCYLAEDEKDFIEFIKRSVEDYKTNESIVQRAMNVYNKTFRPDVAGDMLIKKILKC